APGRWFPSGAMEEGSTRSQRRPDDGRTHAGRAAVCSRRGSPGCWSNRIQNGLSCLCPSVTEQKVDLVDTHPGEVLYCRAAQRGSVRRRQKRDRLRPLVIRGVAREEGEKRLIGQVGIAFDLCHGLQRRGSSNLDSIGYELIVHEV